MGQKNKPNYQINEESSKFCRKKAVVLNIMTKQNIWSLSGLYNSLNRFSKAFLLL
jgi:hypothetical protein